MSEQKLQDVYDYLHDWNKINNLIVHLQNNLFKNWKIKLHFKAEV